MNTIEQQTVVSALKVEALEIEMPWPQAPAQVFLSEAEPGGRITIVSGGKSWTARSLDLKGVSLRKHFGSRKSSRLASAMCDKLGYNKMQFDNLVNLLSHVLRALRELP